MKDWQRRAFAVATLVALVSGSGGVMAAHAADPKPPTDPEQYKKLVTDLKTLRKSGHEMIKSGNYDIAYQKLHQAIDVAQRLGDNPMKKLHLTMIRMDLTVLQNEYERRKEYGRAAEVVKDRLSLVEQLDGANSDRYQQALSQLVNLLYEARRPDEAKQYEQKLTKARS